MLPKILCLHGSGTSAEIFRIQAIRLGRLLQARFELVYVDGFIECAQAGPGVLPFFEGMGPYRRWLTDADGKEERPWGDLGRLAAVFEREGPFVGVIGFSQGAKAALHLLRWLEQEREKEEGGGGGGGGGGGTQLDFAALFGGTVPFRLAVGSDGWDALTRPTVRTRSVHVIGDDDPWRPESEALLDHFDASTRELVRFKGGHHMPVDAAVNEKLAKFIISCHEQGSGALS